MWSDLKTGKVIIIISFFFYKIVIINVYFQKTYDKYCISNGTRQNSTNGFHSDEENSSEFESDDLVDVANNEHERLYHVVDHQNHQRAMCEVLAPCAYTYHCVAQSLYILYRNSMLEAEFIRYVIKDIKQRVEIGECPYGKNIINNYLYQLNIILYIYIFYLIYIILIQLKVYRQIL